MKPKRIIIIGGVAGGASCAARLRRLDEQAEIHMIDRGPYVSFANCGLPYFVGGVIASEKSLLVADAKLFEDRYNIRVRVRTECLSVDPASRTVTLREIASGTETEETYDALVLSPGASPLRPPLPGIDLPGIFTVRTIPDSRAIRDWIDQHHAKRAVVVGGGFIGLEMAENLVHRGIDVTVVEMLDQVMPPLDPEIAAMVAEHLQKHGVTLALGDGVAGFAESPSGSLLVHTKGGAEHEADLVILAIGVRPETALAEVRPSYWPRVNAVFQAYHLMIAIGTALLGLVIVSAFFWWRGWLWRSDWWPTCWLLIILVFSVLGPQIANQAGWFTAELGRQPWIVYDLLKTSQALSKVVTANEVLSSLILFFFVYALLFALFVYTLTRKIQNGPDTAEESEELPESWKAILRADSGSGRIG